jgi:hypothetical protein
MDHSIWKEAHFDLVVVDHIKKMTARNLHSEALVLGAKMFGAKELEKKAKLVLELIKLEGHMPKPLGEYNYSLYQQMMEYAKRVLAPEEFDQFHRAF